MEDGQAEAGRTAKMAYGKEGKTTHKTAYQRKFVPSCLPRFECDMTFRNASLGHLMRTH